MSLKDEIMINKMNNFFMFIIVCFIERWFGFSY